MALTKLGGLAQDVRGSLAGTTFSRNKGGSYVRQKVSPVQPVSAFSSASRAIFAALAQRWSTVLTPSQRAGWVSFASTHTFVNVFGDSITLSGIAIYQSVNRAIGQVGKTYIDDAPVLFSAPAVTSFIPVPVITAGVLSALPQTTTLSDSLPADGTLYVFATPPMSASVKVQKTDFRLINAVPYSLIGLTTAILAAYNDRFGTPAAAAGQNISFRVAVLDWSTGAIGVGLTQTVLLS